MSTKPTIELLTERSKLVEGAKQTVDLLVRISSPEPSTTNGPRPNLNIGIALDRSGSMAGQKMEQAREAAKFCVDQLLSSDVFSTVIFDDQVDVLFTAQPVTDRDILKRGIDRITSRNSTALHQGWVQSGLRVSETMIQNGINRIFLITDGQANVGETNIDRIVTQAQDLFAKGISTTTIGIGTDFNEDLLMPMAEAGGGNAWHVQEPQDTVRIFETELHGLVRQFGSNVRLNVQTADGVRVVDVLNDFEKDRSGFYELPNLLFGSSLDVVVGLEIPTSAGQSKLATFELTYVSQADGETNSLQATFEPEFAAKEIVEDLARNYDVVRAAKLLMNARARREAIDRMDAGEYDVALRSVAAAASSLQSLRMEAPSFELDREMEDLMSLKESLQDRGQDAMSRKRMAYSRESTRKGR